MSRNRSLRNNLNLFFSLFILLMIPSFLYSQESGFTLRLGSGASFPIGSDTEFFNAGFGVNLATTAAPKFWPWIFASLDVGYDYSSLEINPSASLLSAQGGLGFQFPIGDRFHFEIMGSGGGYYGILNGNSDVSSGGGVVGGSTGLYFGFSSSFELGLEGSYDNYLGLGSFVGVGLCGVYRFGANRAALVDITPAKPLIEAVDAQKLRIDEAEFDEIFPVFFKYYDTFPIGRAQLTNVGNETLTGIHLNLLVGQYMDTATACPVPEQLKPGESAMIEIFSFFNDTVLDLEEATKVSAELILNFMGNDVGYQRTYTQSLRLHSRNSMVWDDLRKPAAYITPRDTVVMGFSREVSAIVRSSSNQAVHPSIRTAIALHTALSDYGTTYTPDPSSSYRQENLSLAVDYLQFPRQTLNYKAGDCDDLSILYCAVLESLNIPTAMILIPGHIFIAFNLKMSPAEARTGSVIGDNLIFHNDETWIPIEITSIDNGFLDAWQTGARQWRDAVERGEETFIVTAEAWEDYEPVGLKSPGDNRRYLNEDDVRDEYEKQLRDFIDYTIYPQETSIRIQIESQGPKPELINRLGVLFARFGLYDRARDELNSILRTTPDYMPAIANLGNIEFKSGNISEAIGRYERALELQPENPTVLISYAKANYQTKNYDVAAVSYEQARKINPGLAQRYSYLTSRTNGATRAAESGDAGSDIPWVGDELQ